MSHATSSTPVTNPFTPQEWQELRVDDKNAATAIVALMVAIFIAGVIGYIGVCFWVA